MQQNSNSNPSTNMGSLICQLVETDEKIRDVKVNQKTLNQLQRDQSLFASKADRVSQLNVTIKDQLTEIQAYQEEIQGGHSRMKESAQAKQAIQAGIDTLNYRGQQIATDFKNFLQAHQKVLQKQEEKKERLMGGNTFKGKGLVNQIDGQGSSLSQKRSRLNLNRN